jgi:hypothetical protein
MKSRTRLHSKRSSDATANCHRGAWVVMPRDLGVGNGRCQTMALAGDPNRSQFFAVASPTALGALVQTTGNEGVCQWSENESQTGWNSFHVFISLPRNLAAARPRPSKTKYAAQAA